MKKCNQCKIEKDIIDFRNLKNNRVRGECKSCESINNKKWIINNKDVRKEYSKRYREQNKDKIKENKRKWWLNNKGYKQPVSSMEKRRISKKIWNENNKKSRNSNRQIKYKEDYIYKLEYCIRSSISNIFKRKGIYKTTKTEKILGCSFIEFKIYIESKFEDWMTFENHGLYNGEFNNGWDIDHIIPMSSAKTEEKLILLCHFSNLQPLCSKINRDIKKDNIL